MNNDEERINLTALAELQEIMGPDFNLLLDTFLNDSAQRLRDVKKAFKADDPQEFGRACHSFKGSATNLGLLKLASFCKEGESLGMAGDLTGADKVIEAVSFEMSQVIPLLEAQKQH